VAFWLTMVAFEGVICILFADVRFLPAKGLDLSQVPAQQLWWIGAYLVLLLSILAGTVLELRRVVPAEEVSELPTPPWQVPRMAGLKLAMGLAIIGAVIGVYSIYWLSFYPR